MNRAEARIDRDAIRHNLGVVRESIGSTRLMVVVKADGYGHGMIEVARTARSVGAEWLGVALPSEALALRAAGDTGPVLAWLFTPGDPDVAACVDAGVDLTVSSLWALDQVADAARALGRRAHIHLKVDTGLSRNGAQWQQWAPLAKAAQRAQADGLVDVVSVWSHLANADRPDDVTVREQGQALAEAVEIAQEAGLEPEFTHLANSAAALAYPSLRLGMVRVGIATYGLAPMVPGSAQRLGLRPAMALRARVALVKRLPAGASVSYGSTWTANEAVQAALIPLGYADGIPRAAGNRASVRINDHLCPIVGRVAMDQFVVTVDGTVRAGDEVTVFGDDPTADDWAAAVDTIGYEIVTRIGARVPRTYVGSP